MNCAIALIVSFACTIVSCTPTRVERQAPTKPIFAHYMIGSITPDHTQQDIQDAKALGLDAFALNINTIEFPWATDTVNHIFNQADQLGFGLFFSFDHASSAYFNKPSQYAEYLKNFITRSSYFKYNGKALVSTFGAETVTNDDWTSFKATVGDVLIIPGFYKATPRADFFSDRMAIDGIFNWNSWPAASVGKVAVSDADDKTYLSAAQSVGKLFMLGISPLQFKHMDADQNNWYLRGEDNLETRLEQALALQPDMIELQTWNDAGESHYFGNNWDDPVANTPILAYTKDYDHRGYWKVLAPFIQAWKRGNTTPASVLPCDGVVQGAFWHHPLTVGAECGTDGFGKPRDIANAEDVVSGIVLVAKGKTDLSAVVWNGDKELGKIPLAEGYNKFKFEGLGPGAVAIEVQEGNTTIASAKGPIEVSSSAALCNYNFQVVGFSSLD